MSNPPAGAAAPAAQNGASLVRNTLWNLLGQGLPLPVAIIAVPLIIQGMGIDRFGILALGWVITGYFSIFDLGLGRALTQLVAERLHRDDGEDLSALIWTALAWMACLGTVGAACLVLAAPWIAGDALKVPATLEREMLLASYALAPSIPVMFVSTGLRGVLEAQQRFTAINLVRIPHAAFTFLAPVLLLPVSNSLVPAAAALLIGRLAVCAAFAWLCLKSMPALRAVTLRPSLAGPLFRFGGWLTVSNLIGPLMVHLDRLLIGSMISVAAVAFYTTPHDALIKLTIIPAALAGVLYPAFASLAGSHGSRLQTLYPRAVLFTLMAVFPFALTAVTFAFEGLDLWLGAEFARNSTRVAQWLGIGIFLNCVAQIPFALVQGRGRPDLTAKLHLAEAPLYLIALVWLLERFGIEGAAIAWTIRAGFDASLLLLIAHRLGRTNSRASMTIAGAVTAATLALALGAAIPAAELRALFVAGALAVSVALFWRWGLTPDDRNGMLDRVRPARLAPRADV